MRNDSASRPLTYGLVGLLLFQGLSGLAGGYGLVADPSGAALGLPLEWLAGSPFSTYLIPGLILLLVLGVGPLIGAYLVAFRKPGGGAAAVAIGASLVIWIGVQIAIVGYQPFPPQLPFQVLYGLVGAIILALGVRVRTHTAS